MMRERLDIGAFFFYKEILHSWNERPELGGAHDAEASRLDVCEMRCIKSPFSVF